MDATEVVEHLDTMAVSDRPDTLIASVQPTELVLTDTTGGSTATLPMPDDTFYLSVAPYEAETHDCTFHSLTTCLGEMPGESVDVTGWLGGYNFQWAWASAAACARAPSRSGTRGLRWSGREGD